MEILAVGTQAAASQIQNLVLEFLNRNEVFAIFPWNRKKPDQKEVKQREQEWQKEKELLEIEQRINREKRKLKNPLFNLTTTKLIMLFLFINCTLVEIFTGWVTIKCIALAAVADVGIDLTPLITLIGAVVTEVMSFCVYAVKSARENTQGGVVFETAMRQLDDNETSDAEDDTPAMG